MAQNYDWCMNRINMNNVKTIYEIGSRDGLDAITMAKRHPEMIIYAFECNPYTINDVYNNTKNYTNIKVVNKAVTDKDGTILFRPYDITKYNNPGSSSLFETDFTYHRPKNDPDYGLTNVQLEVTVPCIRLDTFIQDTNAAIPELILMDLQGAEFLAMKGFEDSLKKGITKYIITESCCHSTYKGGCTIRDLVSLLYPLGFKIAAHSSKYTGNNLEEFMNFSNDVYEFDVLFIRDDSSLFS